jgi:hypothetical protein
MTDVKASVAQHGIDLLRDNKSTAFTEAERETLDFSVWRNARVVS